MLAAHVHVYNMHVCASILNGMCSSGKDVFYICRVNNHLDFGKGFNELMEKSDLFAEGFCNTSCTVTVSLKIKTQRKSALIIANLFL